jgi:hypothetical protein
MRVPAQTAPATRTTTDPWSSGSTVGIFQVRDSDGFDLKGMGLCLSLCMHNMHAYAARLLAYCSVSLLAAAWTNQSAYSLRLSIPSLSCLSESIGPEPVLSGQTHQRIPYVCPSRAACMRACFLACCYASALAVLCPVASVSAGYRPFCFYLFLFSPFSVAASAVLGLSTLQSSVRCG